MYIINMNRNKRNFGSITLTGTNKWSRKEKAMTIKMIKVNGIPTAVILENITTVRPVTTWASEITFIGGQTMTVDMEFYNLMKHL